MNSEWKNEIILEHEKSGLLILIGFGPCGMFTLMDSQSGV